eukprot:4993894-Prymnesium_polylepis.2
MCIRDSSSYAGVGDFDRLLTECAATMPLALIYGQQDPWVTKEWGLRAHRRASAVSAAVPLYEISPCGHCAHHEAPNTINRLLAEWVESVESEREPPQSIGTTQEDGAVRQVQCARGDGHNVRGPIEWLALKAWQ